MATTDSSTGIKRNPFFWLLLLLVASCFGACAFGSFLVYQGATQSTVIQREAYSAAVQQLTDLSRDWSPDSAARLLPPELWEKQATRDEIAHYRRKYGRLVSSSPAWRFRSKALAGSGGSYLQAELSFPATFQPGGRAEVSMILRKEGDRWNLRAISLAPTR